MQEACQAFRTAVYDAWMGIQTFYNDLVDHAQNMAVYPDEFTIREMFLDGIPAEMCRALIRDNNLSPEATWDVPLRVGPPKVAFGSGDTGYKPSGGTAHCYNCGWTGHFSKECKVLRAQVRAAHTAAVESNTEAGQEEPANDNDKVPQHIEEQSAVDDAESVQINGNEYVAVDKAADKLQRPHYTPQEKECLVTYVEVNGCPAWMLWDSGSTTMGIMPQFAHVNAIHVHELTELLMLQLDTVGSCTVVQFGVEVRVKMSGQLTKEYVDIANFDCYDMIIGTLFMRKNKVVLDFVNSK
ncbi:hypothetical protein C0992_001279, partial [Termitomyces sp. T32_za158]